MQALLVTFLWSTSWVLIKTGLRDMPALPFAGLRYSLAFLCLLPLALRTPYVGVLRSLRGQDWVQLGFLGLLYYALTQGAQFLGLAHLSANTVSLMLSFTLLVVALLGVGFLSEPLGGLQWGGVGLSVVGAVLYFHPFSFPAPEGTGLVIAAFAVLVNAASTVVGRHINRQARIPPLIVTTVSMGIGAFVLLVGGMVAQGLPHLDRGSWAIIAWLAVVNTAFAFTLWNQTLRTLSAVQSSVINNTMLVQIAVLAWVFLRERPTLKQMIGMALVGLGAWILQIGRGKPDE
jgi:drug/metabolite transporter (DMT)-like permease